LFLLLLLFVLNEADSVFCDAKSLKMKIARKMPKQTKISCKSIVFQCDRYANASILLANAMRTHDKMIRTQYVRYANAMQTQCERYANAMRTHKQFTQGLYLSTT